MSQASHKKVIELLLQGKTITEVAGMLDVSRTTVYNRKKEFLDYAQKEGLLMATERFEVEDTFQKLSNLAHQLELNDLEIQDALDGSEIITLLSSLDVDDPKKFINEVMKKSYEDGINSEEITNYAIELKNLEEKEKKSYSQLIDEIEEKKSEFNKLQENLNDIRDQITQEAQELKNQLTESHSTKEKLDIFISTKKSLESYDLNFDDIIRLENLVTNIKQHDFDLENILNFYDSAILLTESFDRKREENDRLEAKNNELKKENDRLESLLHNNMSMLSTLRSFEKKEITPENILEILKLVAGMSQGLNLSEGETIEKFIEDIKTQYVERNGYNFQLEELKKMQKIYQDKITILKEELDVLEEVTSDRKNMIEAIRRVEALKISEDEIIEWSKLIKELGYEVSDFRNMLNEIGGIPNYIDLKTREIRDLTDKKETLQKNISDLKTELTSLKDVLALLRENIEEETNKIKLTVDEFEEFFTSPETGFKVRSTEIVNDITENMRYLFTETQEKWSKDLGTLDEDVEKILNETERILQNSYKGGRVVGQFHSLEPIIKILREEEVSMIEGTISVITMLTYIQNWLRKNKPDGFTSFDEVINSLMEDLNDIY